MIEQYGYEFTTVDIIGTPYKAYFFNMKYVNHKFLFNIDSCFSGGYSFNFHFVSRLFYERFTREDVLSYVCEETDVFKAEVNFYRDAFETKLFFGVTKETQVKKFVINKKQMDNLITLMYVFYMNNCNRH